MKAVGEQAPDFRAPTSEGELCLYEQLQRGPVVLYFYNRNFTPGCTAQARRFRDVREVVDAAGATVLGVSRDSVESHEAFVKSLMLGFPLVSDPEGKIVRAFGVRSFLGIVDRATFVIDQQRIIRGVSRSLMATERSVDEALQVLQRLAPPGVPPLATPVVRG